MAPTKPAKSGINTKSPSPTSARRNASRVTKSKPPQKATDTTFRKTCYWPVCEAVNTDFKQMFKYPFNVPDVRNLCYLTPAEVFSYETIFFWIDQYIAPILKAHPKCYSNHGIKWEVVLPIFQALWGPGWTEIAEHRCLGTAMLRKKNDLFDLINKHNERVEGQSLQDRAARTIAFLRTMRDPMERNVKLKSTLNFNVPEDKKPVEWKEGHPSRPLIPTRDRLLLVQRRNEAAYGTDITGDDAHANHGELPEDLQEVDVGDVYNGDDTELDDFAYDSDNCP